MRGRRVKSSAGAGRRGREIAILLCDDFTSGALAPRGAAGRGRRFAVVGFATGSRVGASVKKIDSTHTFLWAAARRRDFADAACCCLRDAPRKKSYTYHLSQP